MNTADVLREAADYIDEHGWCQGSMRDRDGRVCTAGALYRVHGPGTEMIAAERAMREYLDDTIVEWNDDPLRTEEQVTKTLRACADSLESDER